MHILELLIFILVPIVFFLTISVLVRMRIWRTAWYAISHSQGIFTLARNTLIVLTCAFLIFAPFVMLCVLAYQRFT